MLFYYLFIILNVLPHFTFLNRNSRKVKPRLTAALLIQPPCYNGHFILAQTKA